MNSLTRAVLLFAFVSLLPLGCKKAPLPPKPTPVPSPTPVPAADRIAFTSNGRLYSVHPLGGTPVEVYSASRQSVWFPEAEPGGRSYLAWISEPDGTQNVARISQDGATSEYLTAIYEKAKPAMKNVTLGNSPMANNKGDKIVYSFNGDIWIMDADGYNPVTLIADHSSWAPAWSPDDKKLAYVNGQDGSYNLWITNIEDRDTYQVTDFNEFSVGHPRWSRNGKFILFTKSQKDTSQVAQVLADVTQPLVDSSPITRDEHSASAEFSPDGLKIIYSAASLPLQWKVWMADEDGSHAVTVTTQGGLSPTWLHPLALAAAPAPAPGARLQPTPYAQPTAPAAATPRAVPQETATTRPEPTLEARRPLPPALTPSQRGEAPGLPAPPAQPLPKAAPLKISVTLRFVDGTATIDPASMPRLKTLALRAKQYSQSRIRVRGPLDNAPLEGRFTSTLERSQARASSVRQVLATELGVPESRIEAVPYTPLMLGAPQTPVNGLQVYIELR